MSLRFVNNQKKMSAFCIKSIALFCMISMNFTYAQTNVKTNYSDTFIKKCIVEVFQDKADELIFSSKSKSKSLQRINRLFKKRLVIKHILNYTNDNVVLLSTVPLFDKYNKNLVVDTAYNSETFNPLKYKFKYKENKTMIYRIDATDYLIFIHP